MVDLIPAIAVLRFHIATARATRPRHCIRNSVVAQPTHILARILIAIQIVHLQLRPYRLRDHLPRGRNRRNLLPKPRSQRRYILIDVVLVCRLVRRRRITRQHQRPCHRVSSHQHIGRTPIQRMSRDRRRNRCIHIALAHCLHRHRSRQYRALDRAHLHRILVHRHHPELPAQRPVAQVIHHRVVAPHRRRARIRNQLQTQHSSCCNRCRSRPRRHRLPNRSSKSLPADKHRSRRCRPIRQINRICNRSSCNLRHLRADGRRHHPHRSRTRKQQHPDQRQSPGLPMHNFSPHNFHPPHQPTTAAMRPLTHAKPQ